MILSITPVEGAGGGAAEEIDEGEEHAGGDPGGEHPDGDLGSWLGGCGGDACGSGGWSGAFGEAGGEHGIGSHGAIADLGVGFRGLGVQQGNGVEGEADGDEGESAGASE